MRRGSIRRTATTLPVPSNAFYRMPLWPGDSYLMALSVARSSLGRVRPSRQLTSIGNLHCVRTIGRCASNEAQGYSRLLALSTRGKRNSRLQQAASCGALQAAPRRDPRCCGGELDNVTQHQQGIYLAGEVASLAQRLIVGSNFSKDLVQIEGKADAPIAVIPHAALGRNGGRAPEGWLSLAIRYHLDEEKISIVSIG